MTDFGTPSRSGGGPGLLALRTARTTLARRHDVTTRRGFIKSVPATGAAFAVAGRMLLEESPARAQPAAPHSGHFDPKGKAPSKFTVDALKQARADLPFADRRDFEEHAKGFIAPMPDLQIMADGGHVAWDMKRFQFLTQQPEFDSIHPS